MPYARTTSFAIRNATADDAAFILSLTPRFVATGLPRGRRKRECLAAIREATVGAMRDARASSSFFVAEDTDGEPAAFLHLQIQRDFFSGARACHISDLVVTAGHEGKGIGRALLAHARTWARQRHCKLLTLSVFAGNTRARALYERAGFAPELVRMIKPLR